jgi:AcrR family transcriptional regulator
VTTSDANKSPFNKGVQHQAKRDAILSRAAKLFNTKGARATTLNDVAEKLGLTKTSLYYYVKTKEDLIFQCYEASMVHTLAQLDDIEQHTQDPLERTLLFMQRHIETILKALSGEGDYFAAPLELASLQDARREALRTEYLNMFKRVRGYVREGIAAGVIRDCHTTTTTRALIGALDWSFYWLYEMPKEQAQQAAADLRDIIGGGLLVQPSRYHPAEHPITLEAAAPTRGFDREAQNRLKQEAFYKAGTRFFNRKGFGGTSLDEIAEYLQVSKGAFYYHFANKDALLTACYQHSLNQLEAIYDEVEHTYDSAPAQLDIACRRIFNIQNSELGPMIRFNTITALPTDIRREILVRTDAMTNRLGAMMQRGIAQGLIRDINVPVAQNLLMGAINAAMDLTEWRKMDDIDRAGMDYFDVFYFGLKA